MEKPRTRKEKVRLVETAALSCGFTEDTNRGCSAPSVRGWEEKKKVAYTQTSHDELPSCRAYFETWSS